MFPARMLVILTCVPLQRESRRKIPIGKVYLREQHGRKAGGRGSPLECRTRKPNEPPCAVSLHRRRQELPHKHKSRVLGPSQGTRLLKCAVGSMGTAGISTGH